MSSDKSTDRGQTSSILSQPWSTTWRKGLVSLPRLVPDFTLRLTNPEGPQPVVHKIPSRGKHHIPLYIFIPPETTTTTTTNKHKSHAKKPPQKTSLPVLLDFHGGGFVLGACQEQAPFCAKLCRELNCVAISVDYRLGPYARFPAALEDAEDVLNAVIDASKPGHRELRHAINAIRPNTTLDTTRLAFSGASSGGSLALNLALSVPATPPLLDHPWPTLLASTHGTPIPLVLLFPALDTRQLPHERTLPDGLDPPTGLMARLNLEAELMPTYLPKTMTLHPRASPALTSPVDSTLHPAAKTLLVLPEYDSLTASSAAWIDRMHTDGRSADLDVLRVPKMLHGWTQYPDAMLDGPARKSKAEVFDRASAFVRGNWGI